MKRNRGFTVIELLFVIIILGVASVFFFIQKNNLEIAARDTQRKTAINAMYYSLEEVYYKQNGYYPTTIDETVLPSVDPDLFTDPDGIKINESMTVNGATTQSSYRYEATDCSADNHCLSYTLRSALEKEDDFIKTNR